jgi:hypothetical protein
MRRDLLTKIGKMEKAVFEGRAGLGDLMKSPGEPGNILDNLRRIAGQAASGDPIDRQKLNAVTRLFQDTVQGKALSADHLPQPESWSDTASQYMTGQWEKLKELSTLTDAGGHMSWTSLGERVALGVLTGGASEAVFIPAEALAATRNYVAAGGDSTAVGAGLAMVTAVVNLVGGEVISRGAKALPAVAQVGKDLAGEGAEAVLKAAANGNSLAQAAVDAAQGARGLAGQAADAGGALFDSFGRPVANRASGLYDTYGKPLVSQFQQLHDTLSKTEVVRLPWEKPPAVDPGRIARPPVDTPARDIQFVHDPAADISEHLAGMPGESQVKIQEITESHNVLIDTRPGNTMTARRLEEGCLPKGPDIHNKTVNPDDILLGAPANAEGLVGHFKPELPANFDSLPHAQQERLVDRFQQRWSEYANNNGSLRGNPRFEVRDGVVCNAATGKPYTGDIDVMSIRDAKTGKLVSAERANQVMSDLVDAGCGVEHNPQANWDYGGQSTAPPADQPWLKSQYQQSQQIDQAIMSKHQVGSSNRQPLVTFSPDAKPFGTYLVGGMLQR